MNADLASLISRTELQDYIKNNPTANDFDLVVQSEGKSFRIIWQKDINVTNPKWHLRWEEV